MQHRAIPPGSELHEPEGRDVTITFPTEDDAVLFYELLREVSLGKTRLLLKSWNR